MDTETPKTITVPLAEYMEQQAIIAAQAERIQRLQEDLSGTRHPAAC